ncbi:MAG: ATP synthase F0 subunit B [Acidobacteriaceae bacterium]|nr:ATP synthase F0 subunit B [Acidobacteriaceae bacterium]
MRRRLFIAVVFTLLLFAVAAPEAFAQQSKVDETALMDRFGPWKIINTALFAIGLGLLIAKYAPAFFNARSADIQKAIRDATGLKMEADLRYSEIDRKMATLAQEVKRMRDQAAAEMEREHAKVRLETQQGIQRIHHNVMAEIEAFRQEGVRKVRQGTAQAALSLAERRLQDRVAPGEQDQLLREFIHLVERDKP